MNTAQRRDIGQGLMADLWGGTGPGGVGILAFHGGGGVDGSPEMMAPFLRLLTQDNPASAPVAVTVPQYRTLNRDGAVFADMRADAGRALAWAQGQLPPDGRLFVLGASFGGLLALDAVMGAPAQVQKAVAGLILLNPVTDTGPEGFANRVLTPLAHTALSPQIRYGGHPLTRRLRCLIAHGGRDAVVPIAQARRFAALWPGDRCQFIEFADAGHGFFNRSAHAPRVARAVRHFVGLPEDATATEPAGTPPAKPAARPAAKSPAAKGGGLLPEGACMAYGIGAQKAGTSWLFDCLSQSDECHSLPTKELHYFDALYDKGEAGHMTDRLAQLRRTVAEMTETVDPANRARLRRARLLVDRLSIHATTPGDHRPYVEHLLTGYDGQRIICDFTPSYSVLDSDAFAQMDSIGPARFIFILRDPVERLWSQIRMSNSAKAKKLSDAAYLENCIAHARELLERRNPARIPRADYARTMAALEAVVPPKRIHYAFYEDLFTQDSVNRICAFLGIAPVTVQADKRVNLGRSTSLPPDLAEALTTALAPQYAAVAARFGDAVPASWRRVSDTAPREKAPGGGILGKAMRLGNRLRAGAASGPAPDRPAPDQPAQPSPALASAAAPQVLHPRAPDSLPRIEPAQIATAAGDAIHFPDLPGGTARRGWLDPTGAPYVMVLRDAVFYPQGSLGAQPPADTAPRDLPRGLAIKDLGLLLASDGGLFPDSFGKSWAVPRIVTQQQGGWAADLPTQIDTIKGTWLFAELFYAHFGHVLTDMPARLWPVEAGLVDPGQIDGILGQGLLGTGPTGVKFPPFARQLLNGIGITDDQIRFADRPVRIERLIVPRRIAPYAAMWNPVFSRMMRSAGGRIAAGTRPGDTPARIWLSRSRLTDDSRGGPGLAALDGLMERHGFTVIHPQELPFADQIALARGATHMAGPVGSQMHLCAFCTRPGAKVLTVAPKYFKLDINGQMLRDIGGDETHFLIPGQQNAGRRHKATWRFDPALEDSFAACVSDWAAPGPA